MTTTMQTVLETDRKLSIAEQASELARRLFRGPCFAARGDEQEGSCLENERTRKLTPTERRAGWVMRPFDQYSPSRMCRACEAYWYAQVAALRCHEAEKAHCPLGDELATGRTQEPAPDGCETIDR